MSAEMQKAPGAGHDDRLTLARVVWLGSFAFIGVLAVAAIVSVFQTALGTDSVAIDLRQYYWAANAILHGDSLYLPRDAPLTPTGGPYPYPPLLALLAVPLTPLSFEAAGLLVMAVLVLVALATLYVLDVRDWRCYGMAMLWPPVVSAIQTGNVTLWFALAAAIVWRCRDRVFPGAVALGLTLAAKFFLWPLVAWFVATRRFASALVATAVGSVLFVASWAVIGFAGFLDYPHLLQKLEQTVGDDSYTVYVVGLEAGLPSPVARALWLGLGLAILAAAVVLGRRGDERSAFILALGASLALTPIVWLHYVALLLVVVAVAYPRLGVVWFLPLALVVIPGSGHHTPFEAAWTLIVAGLVLALSAWTSLADGRSVRRRTLAAREGGLEAAG